MSKNIYERGVDAKGFANIRSRGDWALFGGITTSNMKKKLEIRFQKLDLRKIKPTLFYFSNIFPFHPNLKH